MNTEENDEIIVKDAFGNILANGDSVVVVKDLKVKGTSATLKKGTKIKNIHLTDLTNSRELVNQIKSFKTELDNLDKNQFMKSMENTDLLNIRDEIVGNLNQFLYLLTFK